MLSVLWLFTAVPFYSCFWLPLDSFAFKCDKMAYHFIKLIIAIEKVSHTPNRCSRTISTPFQTKWHFLFHWISLAKYLQEKNIRTKDRLGVTKKFSSTIRKSMQNFHQKTTYLSKWFILKPKWSIYFTGLAWNNRVGDSLFLYFFAYSDINNIECASEAKKKSMLRPKNGKTKGKNCVT